MRIITGMRWVEKSQPIHKSLVRVEKVLQQQVTNYDTSFGGLFNSEPVWEDVPTKSEDQKQ